MILLLSLLLFDIISVRRVRRKADIDDVVDVDGGDDDVMADSDERDVVVELDDDRESFVNTTKAFLITLSVVSSPSSLAVSWATMLPLNTLAIVRFGLKADASDFRSVSGQSSTTNVVYRLQQQQRQNVDNNSHGGYISQYFHSVVFGPLLCNTTYFYVVGKSESSEWSAVRRISRQACHSQQKQSVFALLVADMGCDLAGQSVARLMREHARRRTASDGSELSLVIVAGDVAYANGDSTAAPHNIWDKWQALMSPLVSHVPLMVAEGNHDGAWGEKFVPLRTRIGGAAATARYYAVDRGSARFVVLSAEIARDDDGEQLDDDSVSRRSQQQQQQRIDELQMRFLEHQLRTARQANSGISWIIVIGHRVKYHDTSWFFFL